MMRNLTDEEMETLFNGGKPLFDAWTPEAGGQMKFLLKVRKVLGKLTDLLIKGRQAGLWSEKPGKGRK